MRSWREVRADAELDETRVADAREHLEARVRAYRLAEVRKRQHRTQVEVAQEMGVGQSRVSKIESGDVASAELGTLRAYIEALGGEVEVVANFGDERLRIA